MAAQGQHAILLVEDDDFNRELTTAMLRILGYANVRTATNGASAVRACTEQDFDLILMDCEMPVMDGLEASAAIRKMGVRTPIVAYTGSDTQDNRARCVEAGMSDFLPKPATKAHFARKLDDWLRQCAQRANGKPVQTITRPESSCADRTLSQLQRTLRALR